MARRYKKQFGGLMSNFFGGMGGGQGNDFLSQVGSALQGFSNEPALSNIFSQSEKLFEGFSSQLNDGQREQLGDVDKMKPVFDLFSLFSNGLMGRGFQSGGQVDMSDSEISDIKKRFGQFQAGLVEGVAEAGAEQNKAIAKEMFNRQYSQDNTNIRSIIPGLREKPQTFKKGSWVRKMQKGGATADQRKTINNQFDLLNNYMGSPQYRQRLSNFFSPDQAEGVAKTRIEALQGVRNNISVVPVLEDNPGARGAFRHPQGNNPFGSIDITPQGLDHQFAPANTALHELTHASTEGDSGLSDKEKKAIKGSLTNAENTPFDVETFEYLSNPTEVHARINEIRKLAVDTGLHKEFGEEFTPEQMKLLLANPDENLPVPDGVNLQKGNFDSLIELIFMVGDDTNELQKLLNTIASADERKEQGKVFEAQQGGTIPVSSRGQFDFPGQPVIVPTPDGSITMNGVDQDILALQNGGATILPANSGMHQFAPGNVLEIPLGNKRRRGRGSRKVNPTKVKSKGGSTTPGRTSERFHRRNRRTTLQNKRGNVGLPFGRKVGY